MPHFSSATIKPLTRRWAQVALGATAAVAGAAFLPATALASHSQVAIIQDASDLGNAPAAMQQFRQLGASTVRVVVPWQQVAPSANSKKKPRFNATDPNAYPAANWAPFDNVVRAAQQDGLKIDFTVTGGAPRWAEANPPKAANANAAFFAWKPNDADYGQFVRAVGTRYDGHFKPKGASTTLPAVRFWAIFNEPNFGQDLGPQASNDSTVATGPMLYRGLVNAGWSALRASGHRHDTILIGEFAAQGFEPGRYPKKSGGLPGNFGQTRPLLFIRDLYCVDSSYHELRGATARAIGCPTTAAASRRFRSQNPGLFNASGVSDHPYPQAESPVSRAGNKVDYAKFQDLGNLERTLDRVNGAYGSRKHYVVYNTEYGYITNPPHRGYVSPATAASYINWAEYLSWKQSRVASTMQYLLDDPPASTGVYAGFASGLYFSDGQPKATLGAYEMPLYLPKTSLRHGQSAEVWGEARPARAMAADSHQRQSVQIQFQRSGRGAWQTVSTQHNNGYFDTHVRFPTGGNVRLAYTYPTTDPFLPVGVGGTTLYSRTVKIS
ncbi:MAG TPA: hypothetical protein VIK04_20395 [Solirubrobacteraceae bacterium]